MPLINEVGKKYWKVRILLVVITVLLWIGVGLHLFPVYWAFITSIKTRYETYSFPPTWWPHKISFASYTILFKASSLYKIMNYPLLTYLKNTLIIVGTIMAIQIPVCALVAYALSKLHTPKWNRILFLYLVGPMLVPGVISLIPLFLLLLHFPFPTKHIPTLPFTNIFFPHIKIINTYWAVILPGCYSAFNVLLFKGFFDRIPDELINAARLDGASELGIFLRIILPISKPIFAVIAYFTFSGTFNTFMWPFIVLKEKTWPLAVIMYKMQHTIFQYYTENPEIGGSMARDVGPNTLMAVSIIQSIPVFIMFIIFREQLMKGIKLRGFK